MPSEVVPRWKLCQSDAVTGPGAPSHGRLNPRGTTSRSLRSASLALLSAEKATPFARRCAAGPHFLQRAVPATPALRTARCADGRRGRTASPARLVRLTCQRKHRCMMPCCGSWYGSQGLLLACRLPAALSAAGHTPSSPPGSPPLACHRRLRDLLLRAGRRHLAVLVETWAS